LESNRKFCAIFRRQVQKSCQETAGRLSIEDGVASLFAGMRMGDFSGPFDRISDQGYNPEQRWSGMAAGGSR
jgi:hypothetical protein